MVILQLSSDRDLLGRFGGSDFLFFGVFSLCIDLRFLSLRVSQTIDVRPEFDNLPQ